MHYHAEVIMPNPDAEEYHLITPDERKPFLLPYVDEIMEHYWESRHPSYPSLCDYWGIGERWGETKGEQGAVCTLVEALALDIKPYAVILASRDVERGGAEPSYLPTLLAIRELWTGTNLLPTVWDGTLQGALALWDKKHEHYRPHLKDRLQYQDDWLVISVDYHS